MPSLGDIRKRIQPWAVRLWPWRSAGGPRRTRVAGLDIDVEPTVFHPRYFGSTAVLGDLVDSLAVSGKAFLDMGTGSGILGLRAARRGARVTALDINPAAVRCAAGNARKNGIAMEVLSSDLFDAVPDRRFDIVVWNVPFLAGEPGDMAGKAFLGGRDLAVVVRFSMRLADHLRPGGVFFGVVSADAGRRVIAIFEQSGFHVERVGVRRWGLGERMLTFSCRPDQGER